MFIHVLNRETLNFAVCFSSVGVDLLFGPYRKSKIRKSTPQIKQTNRKSVNPQQIEIPSNLPKKCTSAQQNRISIKSTKKIEVQSTQPNKII